MQTIYYFLPSQLYEYAGSAEIGDQEQVPQDATLIAPGQPQQGFAYVWNQNSQAWDALPDFRGTYKYDTTNGARVRIDVLGDVVGQGYTAVEPTDAPAFPTVYDWDGQAWVLDQQDVDAVLAASIRTSRNIELQASDWTQLPDVPITPSCLTDFQTYRQELRDIPQQVGFPQTVNYPVAPPYAHN